MTRYSLMASTIVTAAALLMLPGCELLRRNGSDGASAMSMLPWKSDAAKTINEEAPVLRMARLEATIAIRPPNDARIRRLVWEELDESGIMAPDLRSQLNKNGFRVGVAANSSPWALQSLAQDAMAARRKDDIQTAPNMMQSGVGGSTFSLIQGGKSFIEIQTELNSLKLPLNQIPELASLRDRSDLKCTFEVTVAELNDEWVMLNLIPQIHSGTLSQRLSVDGPSEQLPVRQNMLPLYEHQFNVKLLSGEVAVLGLHDSGKWNLGRLFFQPESGSSASEKILMLRMVAIDKVQGKSDPSFRLNAYGK